MKTLITMTAIALTAFTVRASEEIPYIAMPIGIGYAVDVKGARHPNAFCLHDAVRAPHRKMRTRCGQDNSENHESLKHSIVAV
ncbi:MAG: hypothetical protein DMF38_12975 [Verrucomicrobia bacterium]|nr:MAG: hypothetical protein DMF38_12975 [Verrucomicrobiota bacterium]